MAIGIGWVKSDVAELRTGLRAEITADRERIDAGAERLTRIETLLEERQSRRPQV
ncbi:MAG: hypothetical protein OXG51_04745 [Gammaproteobacteria bacterium]|nr:hypothetical protein [Gammaproteobacteria bacterium]